MAAASALPTVSPLSSFVSKASTTTMMISCVVVVKAPKRSAPLCSWRAADDQKQYSTDGGLIPYPIFGKAVDRKCSTGAGGGDGGLIPYPIFGKGCQKKDSIEGDGGLIPYPIFGKAQK
ncbi:unnamed protein product [Linum trigynum]|uniref:Uncharacterized protein n=1 Tax=Linum trigynum TaxID=586398 RepID=A0AAV2G4G0_9ROSI